MSNVVHYVDDAFGPSTRAGDGDHYTTIHWIGWALCQLSEVHALNLIAGRCSTESLDKQCSACGELAELRRVGILPPTPLPTVSGAR